MVQGDIQIKTGDSLTMNEAFLWDKEEAYVHLQRLKEEGYTVIKVLSADAAHEVKTLVHRLEQQGRGFSNGHQIRIPDVGIYHPLLGELLVNLQAPVAAQSTRTRLRRPARASNRPPSLSYTHTSRARVAVSPPGSPVEARTLACQPVSRGGLRRPDDGLAGIA